MKIFSHIDLLRHGEIQGGGRFFGSTDIALTEHGWQQMWTRTEINSPCWDHIVTSPLIRCANFAQAFGLHYSIPITQDDRIKEFDFGVWEGCSAAELMNSDAESLTRFWNNPAKYTPTNAEYLIDFQARVLSAWHDITSIYAGQRILIITHSGVIRTILCHVLQHPIERLLEFDVAYATLRHIQIETLENSQLATLIPDRPT